MARRPKSTKRPVKTEYESDVEQKFVFPLLTNPARLAIAADAVKTKKYLAPTLLEMGKRQKRIFRLQLR